MCYLGTAVRVTSGTSLKLTNPKLLLLGVRGYKDTKIHLENYKPLNFLYIKNEDRITINLRVSS